MKNIESNVCTIPYQKVRNPVLRAVLHCSHKLLEGIFGLTDLNAAYSEVQKNEASEDLFPARMLRYLNIDAEFSEMDFDKIPKTGSLLIIANHPFGGIEGLLLLELLNKRRSDVKVLANYILGLIPELTKDLILVNPFGSQVAITQNISPMKKAKKWLSQGHTLILFPSGEVSSFDSRTWRIRDPQWKISIAALIRNSEKPITLIPVFIPGRNSILFNLLGFIHPRLRTAMLPRQMLRLCNSKVELRIGSPIHADRLDEFAKKRELVNLYLRLRTYILAGRQESAFEKRMRLLTLDGPAPKHEPLVEPVPSEILAEEIMSLPRKNLLAVSGELEAWYARAEMIPSVLNEIGRLREIAFRAIGEGTGRGSDLDEFDNYYYHLFLWNRTTHEIAGSYRIGLTDHILAAHGVTGLYTRTLFKFDETFFEAHSGPAIELGRSFVSPDYQKAFSPLLLLWRGVIRFIYLHPKYTTLFGPVSITHEYHPASMSVLLTYLKQVCWSAELSKLVSARLPPKHPLFSEWGLPEYLPLLRNFDVVSELIREVEDGKRDIPILIKQYLKLNGKMLCFNVDTDFSTVVDGLILVDLLDAPPKQLSRYMGKDELVEYHSRHGRMLFLED